MTNRTYAVVKRDSYKNKFIVIDKETGRSYVRQQRKGCGNDLSLPFTIHK